MKKYTLRMNAKITSIQVRTFAQNIFNNNYNKLILPIPHFIYYFIRYIAVISNERKTTSSTNLGIF